MDGTLTTFDVPGSKDSTLPVSIAWTGQITGSYNDQSNTFHGFIRDVGGAITSFDGPAPDTFSTTPMSINRRGQIAGFYNRPDSIHGFLRDLDGTMTTFEVVAPGSTATFVQSMNESGQITGYYYDAKFTYRAFLRDANGTIIMFDAPGAGTRGPLGTIPCSINRSGQIAGVFIDAQTHTHGFLRNADGTFITLDALHDNGAKSGISINQHGEVTGPHRSRGFVRKPDGTTTTFGVPLGEEVTPMSINGRGHITGFYLVPNDGPAHGFLRD